MSRPARLASAVSFAFLAGHALPALAAPPPASPPPQADVPGGAQGDPATARAREAFAEGVALYDRKPPDYAGALARFRAAYEARPAAAIKRNIALCLRGLGRDAEAADALEEMLAEGGATLKPAVREAATRTLAELAARTATVRVAVRVAARSGGEGLARDDAKEPYEIAIDGVAIPPARLARPLRLDPGAHVLRARAEGHAPAEITVTVRAGDRELPVSLELVAIKPLSTLRLRACRPTLSAAAGPGAPCLTLASAPLRIDGVEVARGLWEGPMPSGDHTVDAADADGLRFHGPVTVRGAEDLRLRVVLVPPAPFLEADDGELGGASPVPAPYPGTAPAPYEVLRPDDGDAAERRLRRAQRERDKEPRGYWQIGMAMHGMGFRVRSDFDAYSGGTRRGLIGAAAVVRAGYTVNPLLQIGGYGELGGLTAEDKRAGNAPPGKDARAELSSSLWSLAPEVRLRTTGDPLRAIAGVAVGMTGQTVSAQAWSGAPGETRPVTRNAGGVGPFGLVELGGQVLLRGTLAELTFFLDVRPAASVKEGAQEIFANTVEARYGVRLMLGGGF